MARILGQCAATGALTDFVTARGSAEIHAIVVCNRGGAATFRLAVAPAGEADAPKHYLFYDHALGAGETYVLHHCHMPIGPGDVMRCSCSGSVTVQIYGEEGL